MNFGSSNLHPFWLGSCLWSRFISFTDNQSLISHLKLMPSTNDMRYDRSCSGTLNLLRVWLGRRLSGMGDSKFTKQQYRRSSIALVRSVKVNYKFMAEEVLNRFWHDLKKNKLGNTGLTKMLPMCSISKDPIILALLDEGG